MIRSLKLGLRLYACKKSLLALTLTLMTTIHQYIISWKILTFACRMIGVSFITHTLTKICLNLAINSLAYLLSL